jgi:hypothetical protein
MLILVGPGAFQIDKLNGRKFSANPVKRRRTGRDVPGQPGLEDSIELFARQAICHAPPRKRTSKNLEAEAAARILRLFQYLALGLNPILHVSTRLTPPTFIELMGAFFDFIFRSHRRGHWCYSCNGLLWNIEGFGLCGCGCLGIKHIEPPGPWHTKRGYFRGTDLVQRI